MELNIYENIFFDETRNLTWLKEGHTHQDEVNRENFTLHGLVWDLNSGGQKEEHTPWEFLHILLQNSRLVDNVLRCMTI